MITLRILPNGSVGAQATVLCARIPSLTLSSPTACMFIGLERDHSHPHMHPKAAAVMPSIETVCT